MAVPYTLAEVRSLVRQRADMENSTFVTTPELDLYIWDSLLECFEVLAANIGYNVFTQVSDVPISPSGGTGTLPVNGDGRTPYKIIRLDAPFNDVRRPIPRMNLHSVILRDVTVSWDESTQLEYTLINGGLGVHPYPAVTTTCKLYYVPFPPQPITATDSCFVEGWEEYIVIDAAIKCLQKEESDTSALERAKQNIIERIARWSAVQDQNPLHIADARASEDGYDEAWY